MQIAVIGRGLGGKVDYEMWTVMYEKSTDVIIMGN